MEDVNQQQLIAELIPLLSTKSEIAKLHCAIQKKIHVAGRTDGCYLSLLSGKSLNNCGYCKGSSSSPKSVNGVQCENAVITTAAAVGIGAAALAIIIVAVILCVFLTAGGVGGGMAYYKKHRGQMGNLGSNPLYVESNREGTNPLYERS